MSAVWEFKEDWDEVLKDGGRGLAYPRGQAQQPDGASILSHLLVPWVSVDISGFLLFLLPLTDDTRQLLQLSPSRLLY